MRSLAVWFVLAVSLFYSGSRATAAAQDAPSPLRVEEDKMRFRLLPHTVLELPVVNSTNKPVSGKFKLSLPTRQNSSKSSKSANNS